MRFSRKRRREHGERSMATDQKVVFFFLTCAFWESAVSRSPIRVSLTPMAAVSRKKGAEPEHLDIFFEPRAVVSRAMDQRQGG